MWFSDISQKDEQPLNVEQCKANFSKHCGIADEAGMLKVRQFGLDAYQGELQLWELSENLTKKTWDRQFTLYQV